MALSSFLVLKLFEQVEIVMVDFMVDETMNQLYDYAVSIAHEIGLTNKILGKVIPFTMTERKQVYCQKLAEQLFQMNNFREPTEIERNSIITSMMVNWYKRWKKWAQQEGYDPLP